MSFHNISYIGQSLVSDNLEKNLIMWLNWNLLNIGGFYNITIPQSGNYGGQPSQLRLANNANYTVGRVWEGFRKKWVWQSGLDYASQPIQISGVYVGNTFQPTSGVGPFKFSIDYENGRVIFDNAISTSSRVKAEYSCNYYQIYDTDYPFWRDVQRNSFRIDDSSFTISSSGIWSKDPQQRIQLPAVVIQASPVLQKIPYQIGNLSYIHQQDFRFYIITETNQDLKFIFDAIHSQGEQQVGTFDNNKLRTSGVYSLNLNGTLNQNTMNYPDLVNNFGVGTSWCFKKFNGFQPDFIQSNNLPLFSAVLSATVETITP